MKSPAAGNEREQRPGHDPGRGERQRDAEERLALARVEILGRLEQAGVDLLERDVERQRHEGQEVVGDPRDDGDGRREQPPVGPEDVDVAQEARRPGPSSARMLSHASVRTRYVTNSGATIRIRKTFFQRPARKAIQYTSGYETSSASIVAMPA